MKNNCKYSINQQGREKYQQQGGPERSSAVEHLPGVPWGPRLAACTKLKHVLLGGGRTLRRLRSLQNLGDSQSPSLRSYKATHNVWARGAQSEKLPSL